MTHNYTPQEALELLLRKVREKEPELETALKSAIDAGKDIFESEASTDRKKRWKYRKTTRFTDEEALDAAIATLNAHFIEQPSFTNSAIEEFDVATLDVGVNYRRESLNQLQGEYRKGAPIEKQLEVEIQTETQISAADKQTLRLTPIDKGSIDEQRQNINRLSELVSFD